MKSIITKIVLLSLFVFLFLPNISHAAPERRIALVIGNSNYADGRLKNPVNDATDIATALKSLGFAVTLRKDADLREMKDEIDNFGNSLKKGDVGLFFYAGHGIQVGGINYLIPVRAKISNANMVEHEALDVNRLLSILDNAGNSVNIVMLDACRDNPIARSSRGAGRGLAFITRQPPGTLISYSTGANQVADDGDERNSPYTAALLKHIKTPGLPVEQVFKRVRNRVVEQTRGKQEPAEYTMLRRDFYFVPQDSKQNTLSDAPSYATKSNADANANDHTFWNSVKDSKNPDELRSYLEQFPSGIFASLARTRIKALEKGETQSFQSVSDQNQLLNVDILYLDDDDDFRIRNGVVFAVFDDKTEVLGRFNRQPVKIQGSIKMKPGKLLIQVNYEFNLAGSQGTDWRNVSREGKVLVNGHSSLIARRITHLFSGPTIKIERSN